MYRHHVFLILFCIAVLSCSDNPAGFSRSQDVVFRTDQATYTLERTDTDIGIDIPFAYINRTGRTIYVSNCNGAAPPALVKQSGSAWIPAWSGGAPDCLSPAIEIRSGATYRDTLRVFAADQSTDALPQFKDGQSSGTYRLESGSLLWSFDPSTFPFGEALPLELRVSTPFVLRSPDQPTL